MSYSVGMPWLWKVACFCCLYLHPYEFNLETHNVVVLRWMIALVTGALVACLLPACVYSVTSRTKTNRFVCESLMLQCVCIVLFEAITKIQTETKWLNYKHVHMLLMYQCFVMPKQLSGGVHKIPYQSIVRIMFSIIFVLVMLCTLLLTTQQHLYMSMTTFVSVGFIGEGVAVLVVGVNRFLEGVAVEYERIIQPNE